MEFARGFVVGLTALLVLSFAAFAAEQAAQEPEQGVGGSSFHKNDITYSTEVVTPHTQWATTLPGGPIKGFFIPSIEFGRDMVEIMQRLSLEPTTVSIDRNWDTNCWGIGDYYGHQFRGNRDDYRQVHEYVEKDLTGPAKFEVMVIPGLNGWSRMTKASRDAILKRVEEGAGLVLIHPYVGDIKGHPFIADPLEMEGNEARNAEDQPVTKFETEVDTRIWDISPLVDCPDDSVSEKGYPVINRDAIAKGNWEAVGTHFITEGLPMGLLPEGTVGNQFYKYRATGDVIVRSGNWPVLAVKNYGKGRVVAFAYVEDGFTPKDVDPIESKISWNYWEYYYSLLSRSIVWAAGRDSGVEVASFTAAADGAKLSLKSREARKVSIDVSARSAFGQALGVTKVEKDLVAGDNAIEIPGDALKGAGWPGGMSIVDAIIRDGEGKATLNWGSATFETTKRASIEDVKAAADSYRVGETLSAVVTESGEFLGMKTRFKVSDDLDRVVAVVEQNARQERYFTVPLEDFLGKYAFITVELIDASGAVQDQQRIKPIVVVQNVRRQKEFQAMLAFGGGKSFLTSTQTRVIRNGGAMSGFTWGGGVDNGLSIPRGSFGIYWYDRGPTTAEGIQAAIDQYNKDGDYDALGYLTKKELFKRTNDKKFLVRTPCLDDPAFLKSLYDISDASTRGKARYNLDYYFVGDEGSITSYSDNYDFCFGPYTLANFRKWLAGQYGSLQALNAKWKTAFKSWDEVMPYTTEEAVKSGNFAPWADHRTYMEISFANTYQTVRNGVTAGDPDGHIAVSGTQATNAYDGCDWYRLDQVIDDFLSYNGGNQWDLHRCFAKPGSMIGYWTGYGSSGLQVQNAIWGAAVHNVLFPNIFWLSSYLNPDLTYSKSARDMGDAFKALKFEGVGKLFMESDRLQDGVAIHYSMPSVHAEAIIGKTLEAGKKTYRSRSGDQDGWVRSINELGMQFDFVAYEQLEKGGLDNAKYKVLVLPMSLALSDKEVKAIKAFAQKGGVVIADAAAGIMDDHCTWQEEGLLNDFFGITTDASSKRELAAVPQFRRGGPSVDSTNAAPAAPVESTAPVPVKVTADGAAWGLTAEELPGIKAVEANVKAKRGKALLKIGDADAVIVQKAGKGTAIYLNVLFDNMGGGRRRRGPEVSGPSSADAYRALVSTILAHANVTPAVKITTPDGKAITRTDVVRYKFGSSMVLALLKQPAYGQATTGMDGVTYYSDAKLGQVGKQEITIKLPGKYYVTDVRTGEALGYTDTVHTSILLGGVLVLGLDRAPVGAKASDAAGHVAQQIDVAGPANAKLGEHVKFAVSQSLPGPRLVRCHFLAPDGSFIAPYAKNVLIEGKEATVVLPSALNDAAGAYTLKVTDVVSGNSAEAKVTLQ